MWGFDNLKDIIEVLIIPLALGGLGVFLPKYLEKIRAGRREEAFIKLICRELKEMAPKDPKNTKDQKIWTDHLQKRFIHEEIFKNPSENRDFILSLDPDLTYHMAQLWINFEKAADIKKKKEGKNKNLSKEECVEIGDYGKEWCYFLMKVCSLFDRSTDRSRGSIRFYESIWTPWMVCIIEQHPEIKDDIQKYDRMYLETIGIKGSYRASPSKGN